MGKGALSIRTDQTGDRDPQKVQEPALKAYRDMASDAAEFQVRSKSLSPLSIPLYSVSTCPVTPSCIFTLARDTTTSLLYVRRPVSAFCFL